MADSKENFSAVGKELKGLYGTYKIEGIIGQGGNGIVYHACRIDGHQADNKEKLAIKILNCSDRKMKEREKREERFNKEFYTIAQLQNTVDGLIPVYDSSYLMEEDGDYEWFVMPYAERYIYSHKSVESKLNDFKILGQIILSLHNAGYAHRDIKPQNILYYKRRIRLSDFGLIWNRNEGSHITEVNDHLGPVGLRPPEMNRIGNVEGVDYQKSDVYLFAKTLWIILTENDAGFQGEYSRSKVGIRLDRDELNVKTVEPLHRLFSKATNYYWEERINMKECLSYIDQQLDVIRERLTDEEILDLKYHEIMGEINDAFIPDNKIYENNVSILKIINELVGMNIVFEEFERHYNPMQLIGVDITPDGLFNLNVKSRGFGYTGVITIAINNLIIDKKLMCMITTKGIPERFWHDHTFTNLNEAMAVFDEDNIYISGNYNIRIDLPIQDRSK